MNRLLNLLGFGQKKSAACVAKERLQIIVSHENQKKTGSDFIQQMQLELMEVISKYIKVDKELIKVQLDRHDDQSILELNVTLPDGSFESASTN